MSGAVILEGATDVGLGLLSLALLLTTYRIIRGPTLADRILGLDLVTTLGISFIGVIGIKTGFSLYIDIAISLGLVGFLSTIAFTRYLLRQAAPGAEQRKGQI